MPKPPRLNAGYRKGQEAARAGLSWTACPYRIAPNGCNRRNGGTWGAVWRSKWLAGWRDETDKMREERNALEIH